MESIRFPGASTARSTREQPSFGPALARADSAGQNDAKRENSASDASRSPARLQGDSESSGSRDDVPVQDASSDRQPGSSSEPVDAASEVITDVPGEPDGDSLALADEKPGLTSEPEPIGTTIRFDAPEVGGLVASGDADPRSSSIEGLVGRGGVVALEADRPTLETGPIGPQGSLEVGATGSGSPIDSTAPIAPPDQLANGAGANPSGLPGAVMDSPATTLSGGGATSQGSTVGGPISSGTDPAFQAPVSKEPNESTTSPSLGWSPDQDVVSRVPSVEVPRSEFITTTVEPHQLRDSAGRFEVPDGRSPSKAPATPVLRQESSRGPQDPERSVRDDGRRPAAVARAEKINQAVEDARSRSSAPGSSPSGPSTAVAEVSPGSARSISPTAQTLPNHGAGPAPEGTEEGRPRTMSGVGRGLETLARQRGGTLTMRLDPPSLGQVKLEMRMDAGRVTVLLSSASESARSLLRDNLGSLRQALEDRGLAVDRLAVETAGRSSEGTSNPRSEHRGDGQDARGGQDAADRQDAGEGRSRGRRDDASDRRAERGHDPSRPEVADFDEAMVQATTSDH